MIPGQGKYKELYLMRTITSPPSSVTIGGGFEAEAGPELGNPTAGSNHRGSGRELSIVGSLQNHDIHSVVNNQSKLTIYIENGGFYIDPDKDNAMVSVHSFYIKYADYDKRHSMIPGWQLIGEQIDFADLSGLGDTMSGLTVALEGEEMRVSAFEDTLGNHYIAAVVVVTSPGAGSGKHYIVVKKYDEEVSSQPEYRNFSSTTLPIEESISIADGGASWPIILKPHIAAAATPDGNVHIVVSHRGVIGGTNTGPSVHHFIMNPEADSPAIDLVDYDIFDMRSQSDIVIDGGISIGYGDNKLVLSVGTFEIVPEDVSPVGSERSVYIAHSSDFITWVGSGSESGRNSIGRIEARASILSANVTITSIASLDTTLDGSLVTVVVACATDGSIWKSIDGGYSWTLLSSPAYLRVPLYSVAIMEGEQDDIVIYAGGELGFLQRSVDGGKVWKIIGTPHNIPGGYDWRANRDAVPSTSFYEPYGWTYNDLEIPGPDDPIRSSKKINGNMAIPYADKDIRVILPFQAEAVLDANGNVVSTKPKDVAIVTESSVLIISNANDTEQIENPIMGSDRFHHGDHPDPDRILRVLFTPDGKISSGTIVLVKNTATDSEAVANHLLLCGNFPEEESGAPAKQPGYGSTSHFLRYDLTKRAYEKRMSRTGGYYFSTDQSSATTPPSDTNGQITFVSDVFSTDIGTAIAVTANGLFVNWQANSNELESDIGHLRDIAKIGSNRNVGSTGASFTDITAWIDGNQVLSIYLMDYSGVVYRSTDGGINWRKIAIKQSTSRSNTRLVSGAAPPSQGEGETLLNRCALTDILALDAGRIAVGVNGKLRTFSVSQRCRPNLMTVSTGDMFMTTANLDSGYGELWRVIPGDQDDLTFDRIMPNGSDEEDAAWVDDLPKVADGNDEGFEDIPDGFPFLNILELPEGVLGLVYGNKSLASLGLRGNKWIPGDSTKLPIPVLGVDGNEDSHNITLIAVTTTGNRTFAFYRTSPYNSIVRMCEARSWQPTGALPASVKASGSCSMPILRKPQPIGIGNARLIWTGLPFPGDLFEVPVSYQFSRNNLAKESPSFYMKTGDLPDNQAISLEAVWDRQSDVVVARMGAGNEFLVNGCGLFNTDFPFANWAISVPGYDGVEFPTDSSNYTEFNMSAVVDEGTFFQTTNPQAVIRDVSKKWAHDQFANGLETHYIGICTNDNNLYIPGSIAIRKITGNTKNSIMYEGVAIDHSSQAVDRQYIVFTDHMFSRGSGGFRQGELINPVPDLMDTPYEFGRFVRLKIPVILKPYHGSVKIGTPVFGRSNPVEFSNEDGDRKAHRYSVGWRWEMEAVSISKETLTKIESIRNLAPPTQRLVLNFEQIEAWEAEVFYGILAPNFQQAFVIVPDPTKPESAKLVRLEERASVVGDGGKNFTHSISLKVVR